MFIFRDMPINTFLVDVFLVGVILSMDLSMYSQSTLPGVNAFDSYADVEVVQNIVHSRRNVEVLMQKEMKC
jgi:hypothetical protein